MSVSTVDNKIRAGACVEWLDGADGDANRRGGDGRGRRALNADLVNDLLAIEMATNATGWSATLLADELVRHDRDWCVASVSSDVVGFAGMAHLAGEGHVLTVAVAPAWQGAGIGSKLIAALLDAADAAGLAGVTLEVRVGNLAARRMYRRAGFIDAGTRPGYYADGEEAVIAWRR
ncbi:MAG: ribosomal protein S18-alanine N-acetyltransferase [Nitriliruptoraceae bacterium]